MKKDKLYGIRMKPETRAQLQGLADFHGISCAEVVRKIMREEEVRLIAEGELEPAKPSSSS